MKRSTVVLLSTLFCMLGGLWGIAFGSGVGDFCVHLNNGADVAYIGRENTLEIWIANDVMLGDMSTAIEISYTIALQWNMGYGSDPPVNEEGRAVNCWDLGGLWVTDDFDNASPDHILMEGFAFAAGLPASLSGLCYTLQFYIPSGEPETIGGISIVPYFYPPAGTWSFNDNNGPYPPDFCGNPTGSETHPIAIPAIFDIVNGQICGDANGDNELNVGDAVFLINHVFKGGNPPDPQCAGDANGDGGVNVGDAVYLIAFVFKGGPAPVEGCCN